ncbi:MAG: hypothetical protein WCZ26_02640 [Methanothrix soehngenii]
MREPVYAGIKGVVVWFRYIVSLSGVGANGYTLPYHQSHEPH